MVYCFVPFCPSNSKNKNNNGESVNENVGKRHYFSPPIKNMTLLEKWRNAIKRSDQELDATKKVCDLHFRSTDFIKEDIFRLPDGKVDRIPRLVWKLAPGAIPTENLIIGETLSTNFKFEGHQMLTKFVT